MNKLTGGCQCGEIKYVYSGDPMGIYICHCKECQKQSGSAFGISVEVRRDNFKIVHGAPKYWERKADSGKIVKCTFCSNCGSRPWHESDAELDSLSIKGGSLDQLLDVSKAIHVWVSCKLPGVIIPENAKQFLEEPDEN
jgi:hypothetical protein